MSGESWRGVVHLLLTMVAVLVILSVFGYAVAGVLSLLGIRW
jgi:hypothetical protein